jgi:hypothetical protein
MKRVTRTSVVINGVSLFDVLVLIYVMSTGHNYTAGAGMGFVRHVAAVVDDVAAVVVHRRAKNDYSDILSYAQHP